MPRLLSIIFLFVLSCSDSFTHHFVSFENWNDQPYTKSMIFSDFSDLLMSNKFIVEHGENLSIDKGTLAFKMLKNKVWIEGGSGAQVVMPIKPRANLWLEYLVYFDGEGSDYEWTTGGKLPGVSGGKGYTGGESARTGDGFSARMMFGQNGRLFAYVYHSNMTGIYGETMGILADNVLKQKKWNRVRIYYSMNTKDNHDGSMAVWVNGRPIGRNDRIQFCSKECQIDKFLLVSFHGGQTPDYKPTKNQKIRFKWFYLPCRKTPA